jgi:hypothetical protein
LIIAIDFDGTLCRNAWPEIGKPRKRVIRKVKRMQRKGHTFILWTCRDEQDLIDAMRWCQKQGLNFDYVNRNVPERCKGFGNDPRKIGADEYWDDKARRV